MKKKHIEFIVNRMITRLEDNLCNMVNIDDYQSIMEKLAKKLNKLYGEKSK